MQSIEGMIIILPKVVSEHFMLKERLGKQETLIDTDSSAYANQKKTSSLHSGPPNPICFSMLSNTYPSSSVSFKQQR